VKYQPEEERNQADAGVPHAEPGQYEMLIVRHKEDVQTRNGLKDVIDFVGTKVGEPLQEFGASLWISGPQTKPDGSQTKGNLWQFRRLAESLGTDALAQYREKDANGHSQFRPMDWRDTHVLITVGAYGVDTIDKMPATSFLETNQSEVGDPQNLDDGRHDTGEYDDIPF